MNGRSPSKLWTSVHFRGKSDPFRRAVVVAKTEIAQTDLVRQLQAKTVHREYLALATGDIARGGAIDAPIGRHPIRRTSMAIVASGKAAVTRYDVRERFGELEVLFYEEVLTPDAVARLAARRVRRD